MAIIFNYIYNLPFNDNSKKANLLNFFTNRNITKVETVLSIIEKDKIKVDYLRKDPAYY
jgi:hypothetical protein